MRAIHWLEIDLIFQALTAKGHFEAHWFPKAVRHKNLMLVNLLGTFTQKEELSYNEMRMKAPSHNTDISWLDLSKTSRRNNPSHSVINNCNWTWCWRLLWHAKLPGMYSHWPTPHKVSSGSAGGLILNVTHKFGYSANSDTRGFSLFQNGRINVGLIRSNLLLRWTSKAIGDRLN